MIYITKDDAANIDQLLLSMLDTPKNRIGLVALEDAAKRINVLKTLSLDELKALVYHIRMAQQSNLIPTLLIGDSTYAIFEQPIKDFISIGGFKELRKQNLRPWGERHPVKMLLIGLVLGFLLNYILELLKIFHIGGL